MIQPGGAQKRLTESQYAVIPIAGLVAGALIALGAVLPWISATAGFLSLSRSGVALGGDGTAFLLGGLALAVVWAGYRWAPELARRRWLILLALLGAAAGATVAVTDLGELNDRVTNIELRGGVATVGAGIWLVIAGCIAAVLVALVMIGHTPSAKAPPRPDAS